MYVVIISFVIYIEISKKKILLDLVDVTFQSHNPILKPNNITLLKHHSNVLFVQLIHGPWYFLQHFHLGIDWFL